MWAWDYKCPFRIRYSGKRQIAIDVNGIRSHFMVSIPIFGTTHDTFLHYTTTPPIGVVHVSHEVPFSIALGAKKRWGSVNTDQFWLRNLWIFLNICHSDFSINYHRKSKLCRSLNFKQNTKNLRQLIVNRRLTRQLLSHTPGGLPMLDDDTSISSNYRQK